MRIDIRPEMFKWARERAGISVDDLVAKFPRYAEWEKGTVQPTLRQLEKFADATYAAFGCFFMDAPPDEPLPIADFRTMSDQQPKRPSLNLLDTVYLCQRRQDWYQAYCHDQDHEPLPFIGLFTHRHSVKRAAASIRKTLGFDLQTQRRCNRWEDTFSRLVAGADEAGILVMRSGIVLSNTHRKLDYEEFRGFALSDKFAPLVFINGSDSKQEQMFTLAHELAHLWLNRSALSSAHLSGDENMEIERWCNQVAAELLVPKDALNAIVDRDASIDDAVKSVESYFKVSSLVALRGSLEIQILTRDHFDERCDIEREALRASASESSGGDFYLTQVARLGERFSHAIMESTLEGKTLYRDAMNLVGIPKSATFHEFGRKLGFSA